MRSHVTPNSAACSSVARAKAAAGDLLASTLPFIKAPLVNLGIICEHLGIEVYTMPCDAFGAMFSRKG